MSLTKDLEKIKKSALAAIGGADSTDRLEEIKVAYLGRKGELTAFLKNISSLPAAEKPKAGKAANEVKLAIESALAEKSAGLSSNEMERLLETKALDTSLPGRIPSVGGRHVLTQIVDEIVGIFLGLGYKVAEGPEVELDWYNFEALNMPPEHPARSLQDTLYVNAGREAVLRTHTSPVQVRVMEKQKPPVYVIAPGRVFRRDVTDPTHSPMFHQIEGFAVDRNVNFGHLIGTLETFIHQLFGTERRVRLRPHFFPYTEPSAEVDVSCIACGGKGCRVCGHNGWLEILGCGMIDPNVFKNVGYDPEEYSGFAFGMGVERIAMLRYGISDIRLFFENDIRFLRQFT
ncbi:MAG: phenylalanine--tRNA ligase subunit alpha [Actinomycetota bacterium]|nr:phenylalanine--tRNA ligase subunit alpha [Actinomycetota bacterium]